MVAYLLKPEGSEDFQQIVDFLNTSHIKFALTENPTIYTSLIQQFWQTASTSTLEDGEVEITATIDGQLKTITEASLRRHLKLEDADGISSLPNFEIFEQLALMSPKKIAWEQFSSNIATAIIFLATNKTFDFSKMVFEGMERTSSDIEILLDQEEPTELVGDLGSGEKGEKEISTANISVSTASATPEVSTAAKNLVYIRRSAEKRKDKGNAIMKEDESSKTRIRSVAKADQAHDIDWSDPAVLTYHAVQNKSFSKAEVRNNMCIYLKNQGGYKLSHFKGMKYEDIKLIFESVWDQNQSFVPKDSEIENEVIRRPGFDFQQKSSKKISREDPDKDKAKKQKLKDDAEKKELRDSMDVVLRDDIAIVLSLLPLITQ
ncbi:hypothetical protein Tco_0190191 [Tanacetum coccineum]